jgi:Fe-S-cluster containining protein
MAENLCINSDCHACCKDPRVKLNLAEAATLRNLGTVLLGLFFFDGRSNRLRGKDGKAYYDMSGDCGGLNENGLCNLFESPTRPKSCHSLLPGSKDCLMIRAEQGLGELKIS